MSPEPRVILRQSEPLRCDCGATYYGVESVVCQLGHRPIKLDWWDGCECGHVSHYDMTGFCLKLGHGCDCEEYTPGEWRRQVTRRPI